MLLYLFFNIHIILMLSTLIINMIEYILCNHTYDYACTYVCMHARGGSLARPSHLGWHARISLPSIDSQAPPSAARYSRVLCLTQLNTCNSHAHKTREKKSGKPPPYLPDTVQAFRLGIRGPRERASSELPSPSAAASPWPSTGRPRSSTGTRALHRCQFCRGPS